MALWLYPPMNEFLANSLPNIENILNKERNAPFEASSSSNTARPWITEKTDLQTVSTAAPQASSNRHVTPAQNNKEPPQGIPTHGS